VATERELAALLELGLAGVAAVRWGWKALESAEAPASLPLVTLRRSHASTSNYADMCEEFPPLADISLQVHTWFATYEAARAINAQVRAIILGAGGWALQGESDDYDGAFGSWRISGDYLGAMMTLID
jgi:hypothetical protein